MSTDWKLVRDFIPTLIKDEGRQPIVRYVDDKEKYSLLKDKLKEEIDEFLEYDDVVELADILEISFTLAEINGYSEQELLRMLKEKRRKRGRFQKGAVLKMK